MDQRVAPRKRSFAFIGRGLTLAALAVILALIAVTVSWQPASAQGGSCVYLWPGGPDGSLIPIPATEQQDCRALVDLYNTTGGAGWVNRQGWLGQEAPCRVPVWWTGVSCDTYTVGGRVWDLNLDNNHLAGKLPASLGNLSMMQRLWLDNNQLTGEIPASLGNLSRFEALALNNNQLSGAIPASLGNLPSLWLLNLNDNQLTGEIPASLGNLARLKTLKLYNNQLSGAIPATLGNLSSLEHLILFNDRLTGEIPVSLGNLARLQTLDLDNNQLSGVIPATLGNLSSLTSLYLHNNQLTGEIPASLGGVTELSSLVLRVNQLSGGIPPSLGNLTKLEWLDLTENQLSGEIPASVGNLAKLKYLHIYGNPLQGELPLSLMNLKNLQSFYFHDTCLTIPDNDAFRAWLAAIPSVTTSEMSRHASCDIRIVDPQPDLVDSNGTIIQDAERLAIEGVDRVGAAADGVTRVLLRHQLQERGTVRYCLEEAQTPADGGLTTLTGGNPDSCVTVDSAATTKGHFAFALYYVPDEFNRGGDEQLKERTIKFKATVNPGTASSTDITRSFKLVRPPVVLVHGFWSNGSTWDNFPLRKDERWEFTVDDYRKSNAVHFQQNLNVPLRRINSAKQKYWDKGLAVTQVDVIAHSMGGILTRLYASRKWYERTANYKKGDVNRLITLNTPHAGTPVANLLFWIHKAPVIGNPATSALNTVLGPIDQGALEDFRIGGSALKALGPSYLRTFTFVGTGGSELIDLFGDLDLLLKAGFNALPASLRSDPSILRWYTTIKFFASLDSQIATAFKLMFSLESHDLIVGAASQRGGAGGSATQSSPDFGSIHTFVTGLWTPYGPKLTTLLNTRPESSMFGPLPTPSEVSVPPLPFAGVAAQAAVQRLAVEALVITSPGAGASVQAGQPVSVTVQATAGIPLDSVLVVGPGAAASDESAPFTFNLLVPPDALGALPIVAYGLGGDILSTSAPVTLSVVTTATLAGIEVLEPNLHLSKPGGTEQIYVSGHFSDQITRNVTPASAGTTYATSNANVATISVDGLLNFKSRGSAIVTVRNTGYETKVNVRVDNTNLAPMADPGPDQSVATGATVTLDGSVSFDLDDDYTALTFVWTQVSGPAVTLANAATDHPSFVADQHGDYTFSLVVRDGVATSPAETVTVSAGTILRQYLPLLPK